VRQRILGSGKANEKGAATMAELPQDEAAVERETPLELFGSWAFRALLIVCILPSLLAFLIGMAYFAHDPPGLLRVLLWQLPFLLACAGLLLPWRILTARPATLSASLLAALVVAHQAYGSFNTFKMLAAWNGNLAFFGIALSLAAGAVSLALYLRRNNRWKPLPFAAAMTLVLAALVLGGGNPQWSRLIFVWQVHYSPWKTDAANLPTNRDDPRLTLPTYTEWDARGRKTLEWSHPNGTLLRTEYYPDGNKRSERLYAEEQFNTTWYPNGRMAYRHDPETRTKRRWNPDGTPREKSTGADAN